jgi:quercetin dioxygenase-like cupin family protein
MTRRLALASLPQLEFAKGVRGQAVVRDGRQIRFVEFAAGFREEDWCHNTHIGYVLAGRLEIEFADAVEVFSVGDALMIPADDKHRARVVEGPVRLFLVEDI